MADQHTPAQERNALIIHKAKCARDRRLLPENSAATLTTSRGCSDKLPNPMRNLLCGGKFTDFSTGLRMTFVIPAVCLADFLLRTLQL
jgi:hypothetical protein